MAGKTEVLLRNVRFAFPELFEAKQFNGQGEFKYSLASLLPKNHPQIPEIEAAMEAAAQEKWGDKAKRILEEIKLNSKGGDILALQNGDRKPSYEGYPGNYFINASSKTRPTVIDGKKNPVTAADNKIEPGYYGNVIVNFWAQDNDFGKKINASLQGVQVVRTGDVFGSGGVAASPDAFPEEDLGVDEGSGIL